MLKELIKKNSIVARDGGFIPAQKNKVNLNGWFNLNHKVNNIGDLLSYIIVEQMVKYNGVDLDKSVRKTKHLFATGSVLLGWQDQTVWGSGFLRDVSELRAFPVYSILHRLYHKTDVRAVRGPLTREVLGKMGIKCPEIYGDPALLISKFYTPKQVNEEKQPFCVVPHYNDMEKYSSYNNVCNTFISDYREFIDQICNSELVVSSSLHGVIIAESYGIPAVLLAESPDKIGFKYKDYYYSTGRYDFPTAKTVEEALSVKPSILKKDVLEGLQNGLIKSFPIDLWK